MSFNSDERAAEKLRSMQKYLPFLDHIIDVINRKEKSALTSQFGKFQRFREVIREKNCNSLQEIEKIEVLVVKVMERLKYKINDNCVKADEDKLTAKCESTQIDQIMKSLKLVSDTSRSNSNQNPRFSQGSLLEKDLDGFDLMDTAVLPKAVEVKPNANDVLALSRKKLVKLIHGKPNEDQARLSVQTREEDATSNLLKVQISPRSVAKQYKEKTKDLPADGSCDKSEVKKTSESDDLDDAELKAVISEFKSTLPNVAQLSTKELRKLLEQGTHSRGSSSPALSISSLESLDLDKPLTEKGNVGLSDITKFKMSDVGKDGVAKDTKTIYPSKESNELELEFIGDSTGANAEHVEDTPDLSVAAEPETEDSVDFALQLIEDTPVPVTAPKKKGLLELPLPPNYDVVEDIPLFGLDEGVTIPCVVEKDPEPIEWMRREKPRYGRAVTTEIRPNHAPPQMPQPLLFLPQQHAYNMGVSDCRSLLQNCRIPGINDTETRNEPHNDNAWGKPYYEHRPSREPTMRQHTRYPHPGRGFNQESYPENGPRSYAEYRQLKELERKVTKDANAEVVPPSEVHDPPHPDRSVLLQGDSLNVVVKASGEPERRHCAEPRVDNLNRFDPRRDDKRNRWREDTRPRVEDGYSNVPFRRDDFRRHDGVTSEGGSRSNTRAEIQRRPEHPRDIRRLDNQQGGQRRYGNIRYIPPRGSSHYEDPRSSTKRLENPRSSAKRDPRMQLSRFDDPRRHEKSNEVEKPSNQPKEFISPLDRLYVGESKPQTGRGYGFQTFKIPKKASAQPSPPVKPEVLVPTSSGACVSSDGNTGALQTKTTENPEENSLEVEASGLLVDDSRIGGTTKHEVVNLHEASNIDSQKINTSCDTPGVAKSDSVQCENILVTSKPLEETKTSNVSTIISHVYTETGTSLPGSTLCQDDSGGPKEQLPFTEGNSQDIQKSQRHVAIVNPVPVSEVAKEEMEKATATPAPTLGLPSGEAGGFMQQLFQCLACPESKALLKRLSKMKKVMKKHKRRGKQLLEQDTALISALITAASSSSSSSSTSSSSSSSCSSDEESENKETKKKRKKRKKHKKSRGREKKKDKNNIVVENTKPDEIPVTNDSEDIGKSTMNEKPCEGPKLDEMHGATVSKDISDSAIDGNLSKEHVDVESVQVEEVKELDTVVSETNVQQNKPVLTDIPRQILLGQVESKEKINTTTQKKCQVKNEAKKNITAVIPEKPFTTVKIKEVFVPAAQKKPKVETKTKKMKAAKGVESQVEVEIKENMIANLQNESQAEVETMKTATREELQVEVKTKKKITIVPQNEPLKTHEISASIKSLTKKRRRRRRKRLTKKPSTNLGKQTKTQSGGLKTDKMKSRRSRHRTELDKLHEDISTMHDRSGVLAATGARQCSQKKRVNITEEQDESRSSSRSSSVSRRDLHEDISTLHGVPAVTWPRQCSQRKQKNTNEEQDESRSSSRSSSVSRRDLHEDISTLHGVPAVTWPRQCSKRKQKTTTEEQDESRTSLRSGSVSVPRKSTLNDCRSHVNNVESPLLELDKHKNPVVVLDNLNVERMAYRIKISGVPSSYYRIRGRNVARRGRPGVGKVNVIARTLKMAEGNLYQKRKCNPSRLKPTVQEPTTSKTQSSRVVVGQPPSEHTLRGKVDHVKRTIESHVADKIGKCLLQRNVTKVSKLSTPKTIKCEKARTRKIQSRPSIETVIEKLKVLQTKFSLLVGGREKIVDAKSLMATVKQLSYSFIPGQEAHSCLLCPYPKIKNITLHYKTNHKETEVLISRLTDAEAQLAIADSLENNYASIAPPGNTLEEKRRRVKCRLSEGSYNCRMCHLGKMCDVNVFFLHVSTHTGEYRFQCPSEQCAFLAPSADDVKSHIMYKHNAARRDLVPKIVELFPLPNEFENLFGYLCSKCNYVQTMRRNLDAHIRCYHVFDKDVVVYKINMSGKQTAASIQSKASATVFGRTLKLNNNSEQDKDTFEFSGDDEEFNVETDCDNTTALRYQEDKKAPKTKQKAEVNKMTISDSDTEDEEESDSLPLSGETVTRKKRGRRPRPKAKKVAATGMKQARLLFKKFTRQDTLKSKAERLELALDKLMLGRRCLRGPYGTERHLQRIRVGPFKASVTPKSEMLYECHVKNCIFVSSDLSLLEHHVERLHDRARWDGKCETCGIYVQQKDGGRGWLKLPVALEHLKFHHRKGTDAPLPSDETTSTSNAAESIFTSVELAHPPAELASNSTEFAYSSAKLSPAADKFTSTAAETMSSLSTVAEPLLRVVKGAREPLMAEPRGVEDIKPMVSGTTNVESKPPPVLMPMVEKTTHVDHNEVVPLPMVEETIGKEAKKQLTMSTVKETISVEIKELEPLQMMEDATVVEGKEIEPLQIVEETPAVEYREPEPLQIVKKTIRGEHKETSQVPKKVLQIQTLFSKPPDFRTKSGNCQVDGVDLACKERLPIKSSSVLDDTFAVLKHLDVTVDFVEDEVSKKQPSPSDSNATEQAKQFLRVKVLDGDRLSTLKQLPAAKPRQPGETLLAKCLTPPELKTGTTAGSSVLFTVPASNPPSIALKGQKRQAENALNLKNLKEARVYGQMLSEKYLRNLFKCMALTCSFTCNEEHVFTQHIGLHEAEERRLQKKARSKRVYNWHQCAYCSCKLMSGLGQHVVAEHGHCAYQCSYCFYRAVCQEYVTLHQETSHKTQVMTQGIRMYHCTPMTECVEGKDRRSKRLSVRSYTCDTCAECFFLSEDFSRHLLHKHQSVTAFTCHICKVQSFKADRLISHYKLHSYGRHQCSYCLHGTETCREMLSHLSSIHPNRPVLIYVREHDPAQGVTVCLDSLRVVKHNGVSESEGTAKHVSASTTPPQRLSIDLSSIVSELGINLMEVEEHVPVTPVLKDLMDIKSSPAVSPSSTAPTSLAIKNLLPNAQFSTEELPANNLASIPIGQLPFTILRVGTEKAPVTQMLVDSMSTEDDDPQPDSVAEDEFKEDECPLTLKIQDVVSLVGTEEHISTHLSPPLQPPIIRVEDFLTTPTKQNTGVALATALAPASPLTVQDVDVVVRQNPQPEYIDLVESDDEKLQSESHIQEEMERLRHQMHGQDDAFAAPTLEQLLSPVEKAVCTLNKELQQQREQQEQVQLQPSGEETVRLDDEAAKIAMLKRKLRRLSAQAVDLAGRKLLKCGIPKCKYSTEHESELRDHLLVCDLSRECAVLVCPHCAKKVKSVHAFMGHIAVHGLRRYECGVCGLKSGHRRGLIAHVKSKHRVTALEITVLPDQTMGEKCVVRPLAKVASKPVTEPPVQPPATLPVSAQRKAGYYGPGDEHLLPPQCIYATDVRCTECPTFLTKVRSNMVRHLRMHVKAAETGSLVVPTTAPKNNVPKSTEKMFDKMTNLAASSQPHKVQVEPDAAEMTRLPPQVEVSKLFKCPFGECLYISCHEEILINHARTLHEDLTHYTCPHCPDKVPLEFRVMPWDKAKIAAHLKYHDARLYKCGHCSFFHYQKHTVTKHLTEKHLDKSGVIVTIREPQLATPNQEVVPTTPEGDKVWKCNCCNEFETPTKQVMMDHLYKVHNCRSKYRCDLCNKWSNQPAAFNKHFTVTHPGRKVSYSKCCFRVSAQSAAETHPAFDTTPLWTRDATRARHIRGILIEDEEVIKKKRTRVSSDDDSEVQQQRRQSAGEDSDHTRQRKQTVEDSKQKRHKKQSFGVVELNKQRRQSVEEKVEQKGRSKQSLEGNDEPSSQRKQSLERNVKLTRQRKQSFIEIAEPIDLDFEETTPSRQQSLAEIFEQIRERSRALERDVEQSRQRVQPVEVESEPVIETLEEDFEEILHSTQEDDSVTVLSCPICTDNVYHSVAALTTHLKVELNYKPYKCNLCAKMFHENWMYVKHHDTVHPRQTQSLKVTEDEHIRFWIRTAIEQQVKASEIAIQSLLDTEIDTDEESLEPQPKKLRMTARKSTTSFPARVKMTARKSTTGRTHLVATPASDTNRVRVDGNTADKPSSISVQSLSDTPDILPSLDLHTDTIRLPP